MTAANSRFVKAVNGYVKRANVRFTKRRMDGFMPARAEPLWSRNWVRQALAVLAIGILVTLIGPFGTFAEMRLPTRAAYWMTIVALSWLQWTALDHLTDAAAERLFKAKPWPWWLQGVTVSLVGAGLLTVELPLLRGLLGLTGTLPAVEIFAWIAGISILTYAIVSGVMLWAEAAAVAPARADGTPPGAAVERFLRRLPPDKRGALICIKTEDHYLRVVTEAGEALILMRFKDALDELRDGAGLQVHRSYWVALDSIQGIERQGRKRNLRLKNGLQVPVSRTFLSDLKAAGWSG